MKRIPETAEPILIECDLPDPPEKVWRALTERELLGRWLMPCDLRAEVGARFHFRPGGSGGNATPIECEILDVEPHRLLRWLQRERELTDAGCTSIESVVTLDLSSTPDGGTRLRLVHDGFTKVSSRIAPEVSLLRMAA